MAVTPFFAVLLRGLSDLYAWTNQIVSHGLLFVCLAESLLTLWLFLVFRFNQLYNMLVARTLKLMLIGIVGDVGKLDAVCVTQPA